MVEGYFEFLRTDGKLPSIKVEVRRSLIRLQVSLSASTRQVGAVYLAGFRLAIATLIRDNGRSSL